MRATFKPLKNKLLLWFTPLLIGLFLLTGPYPTDQTLESPKWEVENLAATNQDTPVATSIAPVCTMASSKIEIPQNSPIGGYLWPRKSTESAEIQMGVLLIGQPNHQIAIVSAEILLFNEQLSQLIASAFHEFGIHKTLFTASHSHSGPGGFGEDGLEKIVLGHAPNLVDQITQGAQAALQTALLRPLKPLYLSQIQTNVLLRRTASTEKLDDRIGIVQCGDHHLWIMHAAHPVTETNDLKINGDWPSLLIQDLKGKGFNEVLYASSSGGEVSLARAKGRNHTVRRLQRKILKAVKTKTAVQDPFILKEYSIKVPSISVPLSPTWQLTGPLIRWLFPIPPKGKIQVLTNRNLDWFFLPYEASATLWSPHTNNESKERFLFHTPFNGQYLGYIIPNARYGHMGPEQFLSLLGPYAALEHQSFLNNFFKEKAQSAQESKDKRPE